MIPVWRCRLKKCETFLGHLNLVEPSIQFTLEQESDGKLPFPDIPLRPLSDGCVSTSVHRKTTHTGKYSDFDSHHPFAHKLLVVCVLQQKANVLPATREAFEEEKAHLANALLENSYLSLVVHWCWNLSGRTTERIEEQPKAMISLPYVHGISEALKRVLEPIGIRSIMKPNQTLMTKLITLRMSQTSRGQM